MRDGLGAFGVAILAVLCCAGLPLLVAACLSVAALAWICGLALGLAAFAIAIALLVVRAQGVLRRAQRPSIRRREAVAPVRVRSRLLRA